MNTVKSDMVGIDEKQADQSNDVKVYSFGGVEAITEQDLWGYFFSSYFADGGYYEPLFPYRQLIRARKMQPLHESALDFKGNIYSAVFKENKYLSAEDFSFFIQDYHTFLNAYLQAVRSPLGNIVGFRRLLAYYIRRGKKPGEYYDLSSGEPVLIKDVIHFKGYSATQNIYGDPNYLAGVLSINLNYESRLFRTRYYKNGSHAGFILSVTGERSDEAHDVIERGLKDIKQSNQFKNILVSIPGGNKESLQLLPLSDIAAKDEFYTIKTLSDDDVASIHRVPLILLSIQPKTAGGFGKPSEAAQNYYITEMTPLINRLKSLNQKIGVDIFQFDRLNYEDFD